MAVDLTDVREGDEITLTIDLLVKLVDRDCTHTIDCEDAEGNEYYFDQGDPGELVIKERPFVAPPAGSVVRFNDLDDSLVLSYGDAGYIYVTTGGKPHFALQGENRPHVWPWQGVEEVVGEIIVNGASE